MSKKVKIVLILVIAIILSLFGIKSYLDKIYLNQFERNQILGNDRFETMTKISQKGWVYSEEAILVSIHSVIDGISVSSFAYQEDIPVFFIDKDEINVTIKDELERLGVEKTYLIGGIKVISTKVTKELSDMNIKTERIDGEDAFETSIKLAEKIDDISEVALVNMKRGKPNGVALAPATAKNNIPIIMVNKSDRKEIVKFVREYNIKKVYLVGTETDFPKVFEEMLGTNISRINGEDRYETNKKIIEEFYDLDKVNNIYMIKNGIDNYADFFNGLSLSAIAARENTPVLFNKESLDKEEARFLEENNIKKINEVGFKLIRPKIISDNIKGSIGSFLLVAVWILAIKRIIYKQKIINRR